jgi:hypothetical protein
VPPLPAEVLPGGAPAASATGGGKMPYTAPLPQAAGPAGPGRGQGQGLAARVGAPFSALTKPKPKKASPKGKKPAIRVAPKPGQRPQPARTPGAGPAGQPAAPQARRAQLRLDRIEPWSVMKFSFLMSLIGWVILFVAVALLYFALSKLGVFTRIESTFDLVTSNKSNPKGANAATWFSASRVLGYTMLVGAINVILITALATVGAVLYNLVTMLGGGIDVTLKESD